MPTSEFRQLNEIMELVDLTRPRSVIDIGGGFGKYGFLARECLELLDGRGQYRDWRKVIDGIEACKDYITPTHSLIYDNIFIGDARKIVPDLEKPYDLALMIDVLEHFEYGDGIELLDRLKGKAKNILIATPKSIGIQGEAFGNPFEAHRFQWKRTHFRRFRDRMFVSNAYSLICYIGEDARRVRRELRKAQIKRAILTWVPFIRVPYRLVKQLIGRNL